MTKAEINRKFDEIVDFSGVERYIDTPAKRYSSGMTVRLGFAIAAHLDPEILVVDEVLAVGDAEFQKKAIGKMQDVSRGEGRTVLFVSHNMGSVATLCKTGMILKNGIVSYYGNIEKTIDLYIADGNVQVKYIGHNISQPYFFKRIFLNNENGICASSFDYKEDIEINFQLGYNQHIDKATVGFTVFDSKLRALFSINVLVQQDKLNYIAIIPKLFLLPATYYIKSVIHVPNQFFIDQCTNDISFEVEDTGSEFSIYSTADIGVISPQINWKIEK